MGLRVGGRGAIVSASLEGGVLSVYLGYSVCHIEIPIKSINFEKQCNFFLNDRVLAFLKNDEYTLVLRVDGTGSLLTRRRKLIKNFKFDVNQLPKVSAPIEIGWCSLESTDNATFLQAVICDEESVIIYSDNIPLSITIRHGVQMGVFKNLQDVSSSRGVVLKYNKYLRRVLFTVDAEEVGYVDGTVLQSAAFTLI